MREALTPEDIKGAEFSGALRGYDRGEVADFLQDVAAEFSILRDSSDRSYQTLGEDIGELLQQAKDLADKLLSDARSEAEVLAQSAANAASGLRDEADTNARQVHEEAEAHARQVREQADADAASRLAEAEEDAAQRISTADARVRELGTVEAEARQRIDALRVELHSVVDTLLRLSGDGLANEGTDQNVEAQSDQQDRIDTSVPVEVEEPAR